MAMGIDGLAGASGPRYQQRMAAMVRRLGNGLIRGGSNSLSIVSQLESATGQTLPFAHAGFRQVAKSKV